MRSLDLCKIISGSVGLISLVVQRNLHLMTRHVAVKRMAPRTCSEHGNTTHRSFLRWTSKTNESKPMATPNSTKTTHAADPGKVTDFILFSQREFLLNLCKDLSRGNITHSQFYLLGYLSTCQRGLTMTDIARKMGHSTAASTGLVDRLEKLGYVERTHDADDRRKVIVRITLKGQDLLTKLRGALQERIAEAMAESKSYDADSLLANYREPLAA